MKEHKLIFIKKSFIFLFIVVMLLIVSDYLYIIYVIGQKQQFSQEVELQYYLNGYPGADKKIDYLFLGDSHAYIGINPRYINGSFNYGFNANTYIEDYYKLRKLLLKDKIKVKNIVLELDLQSFSSFWINSSLITPPLLEDLWYYDDFMSISELSSLSKRPKPLLFIGSYLPFLGHGEDFFIKKQTTDRYLGWKKEDFIFSEKDLGNPEIKKTLKKFLNVELMDPILSSYFDNIFALAESYNITVILIKYPQTEKYYSILAENNITDSMLYPRLFSVLDSNYQDYYFLDYTGIFADNSGYFSDLEHLNYKGAEVLSKKVSSDLADLTTQKKAVKTIAYNSSKFS